jgi:predicted nuclease of predicted toxin-antitoxin system
LRLKLDENLPDAARQVAIELGHDVDTVQDEGRAGASDPEVMAGATRDGRFLLTLDRGLGDVRRYAPGTHPGIAVLRTDRQDVRSMTEAVRTFLSFGGLGDLTGCVVVVRGHLLRIRRPD